MRTAGVRGRNYQRNHRRISVPIGLQTGAKYGVRPSKKNTSDGDNAVFFRVASAFCRALLRGCFKYLCPGGLCAKRQWKAARAAKTGLRRCQGPHIQATFRCLVRQGNIDPKQQETLNGRVHACWLNPNLEPAPATAAAPPAQSPAATSGGTTQR